MSAATDQPLGMRLFVRLSVCQLVYRLAPAFATATLLNAIRNVIFQSVAYFRFRCTAGCATNICCRAERVLSLPPARKWLLRPLLSAMSLFQLPGTFVYNFYFYFLFSFSLLHFHCCIVFIIFFFGVAVQLFAGALGFMFIVVNLMTLKYFPFIRFSSLYYRYTHSLATSVSVRIWNWFAILSIKWYNYLITSTFLLQKKKKTQNCRNTSATFFKLRWKGAGERGELGID